MNISKIKTNLVQMGKKDQELRKRFTKALKAKSESIEKLGKEMTEMDGDHTEILKGIIDEIGLPTIPKVGKEAYKSAWLIAQHAPDLEFQKKYLEMMNENVDDVRKQDIAFLIDRILIKEGKPQIYGTQYKLDKETNERELREIEDKNNLKQRREEMGLNE